MLAAMAGSGVSIVKRDIILSNANQDSDSTIAGFVLQQHLSVLRNYLCSSSASLRYAMVQLIGTLLRQGSICPLDVIVGLIAIQGNYNNHHTLNINIINLSSLSSLSSSIGDVDDTIRNTAIQQLQQENEKHPSFIDNRMLEGIEFSYSFQLQAFHSVVAVEAPRIDKSDLSSSSLSSSSSTLSSTTNSSSIISSLSSIKYIRSYASIFDVFYLSCIQKYRKRKIDFLLGLLKRSNSLSSATSSNGSGSSSSSSSSSSSVKDVHKRSYPNKINKASYKTINSSDVISSEGSSPMKGVINKSTLLSSSSSSSSSTGSSSMFDTSIIVDTSSKCQINDFLTTTLAYLPYETADEPLQIIFWINRNISVSTSLLLHRLKDKLMIIGAVVRSDGSMLPPMMGSKTKSNPASTNKKSMSSSSSGNNSISSTDGSGAVISSRSSSDGSGGRTIKTPSSVSKPSLSSSTNSPTIHESDLIINDQGVMCFHLCYHCQHLPFQMSVHCCSYVCSLLFVYLISYIMLSIE